MVVVAGLLLVQLRAFAAQFGDGFRPFGHPPTRVNYSWDMFSIPIERCGVEWRPPLDLGHGKTLRRLRDLTPMLEWDIVYNTMSEYEQAAKQVCVDTKHRGTAHLDCAVPRNRRVIRDFDC